MKARIAILASLVFFTSALASPPKESDLTTPLSSMGEGPLFFLDYSNYKGVNDETFVEFYIQVSYDELQFIKKNQRFQAEYEIDFSVLTETDSLLDNFVGRDTIELNSYAETQSSKSARVMLLGFSFPPATYKIKVRTTDLETRHFSLLERELSTKNFRSPQLEISDIQLSHKIEPAQNGLPYVKNSRYIEPNVSRVLAHGVNSDIYIYFEVYNFTYFPNCENSTYTTTISFFDNEGNQIARLNRVKEKPGDTSAHSMKFPLQNFKSGEYYVTIQVRDDVSGQVCETSKNFTVGDQPISVSEATLDKWLY